jgi:hypothetical protein
MSPKTAVALAVAPARTTTRPPQGGPARPASPVEALRKHLASRTAREHVVLDFLEDDLGEARAALAAVAAYVANVDAALRDAEPSQGRFLSLAIGGAPIEKMETLAQTLSSVRRRLAQVAARM